MKIKMVKPKIYVFIFCSVVLRTEDLLISSKGGTAWMLR